MNKIHAAGPASHTRHRAGTRVDSRRRPLRHVNASMTSRLVALGLAISLALSASSAALARGGFGHIGHIGGLGHIGHGGGGDAGHGALVTPAYVLISASTLSDKDAFANAVHSLPNAVLPFEGRVISDADTPPSWEGSAAAHVAIIEFDSAAAAQRWKSSDAYKSFDEQLRKASTSSIQQLPGVPTVRPPAMANARMHGRGLDPRAFEPIVKEYDSTLKKMHSICSGC